MHSFAILFLLVSASFASSETFMSFSTKHTRARVCPCIDCSVGALLAMDLGKNGRSEEQTVNCTMLNIAYCLCLVQLDCTITTAVCLLL